MILLILEPIDVYSAVLEKKILSSLAIELAIQRVFLNASKSPYYTKNICFVPKIMLYSPLPF